jgi:hypothetical protein
MQATNANIREKKDKFSIATFEYRHAYENFRESQRAVYQTNVAMLMAFKRIDEDPYYSVEDSKRIAANCPEKIRHDEAKMRAEEFHQRFLEAHSNLRIADAALSAAKRSGDTTFSEWEELSLSELSEARAYQPPPQHQPVKSGWFRWFGLQQ